MFIMLCFLGKNDMKTNLSAYDEEHQMTTSVFKTIPKILHNSQTIAIVGLSEKPDRPSFDVATYLREHGYTIIPINPNLPNLEWCGIHGHRSLSEISKTTREKIDIVDVFRKSEDIGPIVDEAIAIGAKVIWMQLGIVNEEAAERARAAGLEVVMNKCMKIEHKRLDQPTEHATR